MAHRGSVHGGLTLLLWTCDEAEDHVREQVVKQSC
jgi:hypothetical protein